MHVLGTSAYVPELLMRAPEVIQPYADGPTGPKLLDVDTEQVARSLLAAASRHADPVKAHRRGAERCVGVNWPASRRRTCSGCSTCGRCAKR